MVAYSQRTDTSGKWRLPARYHHERLGERGLVSLDTNATMSFGITRKGLDALPIILDQDPALFAQGESWTRRSREATRAGRSPSVTTCSTRTHGNAGADESQGQNVAGQPFPTSLGLDVKVFIESTARQTFTARGMTPSLSGSRPTHPAAICSSS